MSLDDPNEEITSTSGTSVATISVQSSPPESPVMSPRSEAATTSVRVSNAVPSPSAQIVRYRRHVNVTPTGPQETMVSCFHRSPQLLPWIAVTTQSGLNGQDPHSRNFQSCNEWFRRGGQNCNDGKDDLSLCADVGATSCLDRVVHAFPVAGALPTICPCVDIFRSTKMSDESCGLGSPNPEDPNTAVRRR